MKRMVSILLLSVFMVCFGVGYLLSVKQAEATTCCGPCYKPCICKSAPGWGCACLCD